MSAQQDRLSIMKEIHALTTEMLVGKDDSDRLMELVNQRQEQMNRYDQLNAAAPPLSTAHAEEIKKLAQQTLKLDKEIIAALEAHKRDVKDELANSTAQQKALGYINQAMSSTGSYMDYKK